MKYASIILVHYSNVDDFGGKKSPGSNNSRSEMIKEVISAINKNTKYPAELIVIDNGGKPDDSEYLLGLAKKGIINIYVRNKENMHYAFANNQGARIATGYYLCFMCNDVLVKSGWLTKCVEMLEQNPDRKLTSTPFISSHRDKKYNMKKIGKNRLNPLAGSNCMVMDRKTFKDLGDFGVYGDYSNMWYRQKFGKGYTSIAPPENLAVHLGHRGGLDWRKKVKIVKTLLNKKEINFDETLNN